PDVAQSGSQIGGAPALTADDLLLYTVTTGATTANPGRGLLFAANEQQLRTKLRWAFQMHNSFPMPVNGNTVMVPPRLRQMDSTLAGFGEFLTNVQLFGTPAYKDGVGYAVGRATVGMPAGLPNASVICAFRANPDIRLRLNQ